MMKPTELKSIQEEFRQKLGKYEKPALIKFDKPVTIELCKLEEFMCDLRPFPSCRVFPYQRFQYGDYSNWTDAICESIDICPGFSHVNRRATIRHKAGTTSWCLKTNFWVYRPGEHFYKKPTLAAYDSNITTSRHIDTIKVVIAGAYVIHDNERFGLI